MTLGEPPPSRCFRIDLLNIKEMSAACAERAAIVTPIGWSEASTSHQITRPMGGVDKGRTERQVAFGDRIRARRQELGMTQESLALASGIARSYIGSLEGGQRNPSLDNIARLAQALEIDAADLVRGLQNLPGRS